VSRDSEMPPSSVFLFDTSFPSVDIAVPIDDAATLIVVSDREIEPPPGHTSLQLEEITSFRSFQRNLRLLRAAWRRANGRRCVVVAAFGMRREQLLLNTVYALSLSRDITLFDGLISRSLPQAAGLILRSAAGLLAQKTLGKLRTKVETIRFNRRMQSHPARSTAVGSYLGYYDRSRSFSFPLDAVEENPHGAPIYGRHTQAWYLPTLSNHLQRYAVRSTRHRLHDVFLHVEEVGGSPERFLFKNGQMLDYPYLLLTRSRRNLRIGVSTCAEIKSVERGIDLLHFTTSYYHWLVDGVPRILDLIDDGIDFDRYPLLLPPLEQFQRQLLEILGIGPDRHVVTVGKDDWCHVDECICPTLRFPLAAPGLDDYWTQPDGDTLRRIRDRILDRLPEPAAGSAKPSRIYISRAKAARRNLTPESEDAVRSILESEGFQTVFLEDLAWAEQVRLLSGAEYVVGLHGAGLANILFAKNCTLLELQDPLQARAYFAVLARELNMNYTYIVGKLQYPADGAVKITIDPDELRGMLRRIGVTP